MAKAKAATIDLKKGDRVKVTSGNWGASNLGTVAEVKSDRVLVQLDGLAKDDKPEAFGPLSVVKV